MSPSGSELLITGRYYSGLIHLKPECLRLNPPHIPARHRRHGEELEGGGGWEGRGRLGELSGMPPQSRKPRNLRGKKKITGDVDLTSVDASLAERLCATVLS